MKTISLLTILLLLALLFISNRDTCSFAQNSDTLPKRMIVIKGKATIINLPGVGAAPATSESLIFQKVGCESCYVGTGVDTEGNYKILVGEGKYKIIVRDTYSGLPGVDLLAPDQERFIDAQSEYNVSGYYQFDIKIKLPDNAAKVKGL